MADGTDGDTPPAAARAAWMGLLARARPDVLAAAFARLGAMPAHRQPRPPQIGLVMARGRAGATGDAFNLGEVTATRCAVELDDGTIGHACVLGRDREHALRAALCDALMQTARADAVRESVLEPLRQAESAARARQARKAAATRVEFFTMTRGDG